MALDWIMSCWHKVKYTQGDKLCTSLRKPAKKRANTRVVITVNPAARSSLKQHRMIKLPLPPLQLLPLLLRTYTRLLLLWTSLEFEVRVCLAGSGPGCRDRGIRRRHERRCESV